MPTAADFHVTGASDEDLEKLDQALAYITTYMPYNGAPVISLLAELGITITINHDQQNSWNYNTRVLKWDPTTALVVLDSDRNWVGINSAATNFLHEAAHATDPNFLDNIVAENVAFENDAEAYAANVASSGALEAGEVERNNHDGPTIAADNPTTHTYEFDNGEIAWSAVDESMDFMWKEFDFASYNQFECPSFDGAIKPGDYLDIFPDSVAPDPAVSMNTLLTPPDDVPAGRLVFDLPTGTTAGYAFIEQPVTLIGAPGSAFDSGLMF